MNRRNFLRIVILIPGIARDNVGGWMPPIPPEPVPAPGFRIGRSAVGSRDAIGGQYVHATR